MSEKNEQSAVPAPPTASPSPAPASAKTPSQDAPRAAEDGAELTDDQLGHVSGGAGMGEVAMGAARNLR